MKTLFKVLILCLMMVPAIPVSAETGTAGGALPVLRFGVGARAFGMGGAYGVIVNDASAVYWNPAGLAELKAPSLIAMHSELYVDSQYEYIGWATPLKSGGFGISFLSLSTSGIITDTGVETAVTRVVYVAYGRELFGWKMGIAGKYIWEELPTASGAAWSIDFGLQKQLSEKYRVGISLQDGLSSKLDWDNSYNEDIPLNIRAGISYTAEQFLLIAEVEHSGDFTENHIGFEYNVNEFLKLRSGLRGNDLSAGIGLAKNSWNFDYAYCSGDLGNTHRLSVSYQL